MMVAACKGYSVCLHPLRPLLSANSLRSLLTPPTLFETQGDGRAESGHALPSSPFHKPGLAEELSQVLADSCTGGAHHEVQDDLETKRVRRLGSPGLPEMGAQRRPSETGSSHPRGKGSTAEACCSPPRRNGAQWRPTGGLQRPAPYIPEGGGTQLPGVTGAQRRPTEAHSSPPSAPRHTCPMRGRPVHACLVPADLCHQTRPCLCCQDRQQ